MAHLTALKLVGASQGAFHGALSLPDHDGSIRVVSLEHVLTSPRDAATGLPAGKRQHGQLTITKEVDATSPKLLLALVRNEPFTTWDLALLGPDASNRIVRRYRIELRGATVARSELVVPSLLEPGRGDVAPHERVSFVYSAITWTWAGSVAATDQWADNA